MIVQKWHRWVNQPAESKAWHDDDIADELQELKEARGPVARWSEMSDVVYTVTRGRYDGHNLDYPIPRRQVFLGYIYMYPKYSLRVLFFRSAGRKAGATEPLQAVRNPKKTHKLNKIAEINGLGPELFVAICEKQLKHWPLLH
ncbi:MAG: hypothetical protein ABI220_03460 [Candidatus Saccharimonadales bacterium]